MSDVDHGCYCGVVAAPRIPPVRSRKEAAQTWRASRTSDRERKTGRVVHGSPRHSERLLSWLLAYFLDGHVHPLPSCPCPSLSECSRKRRKHSERSAPRPIDTTSLSLRLRQPLLLLGKQVLPSSSVRCSRQLLGSRSRSGTRSYSMAQAQIMEHTEASFIKHEPSMVLGEGILFRPSDNTLHCERMHASSSSASFTHPISCSSRIV